MIKKIIIIKKGKNTRNKTERKYSHIYLSYIIDIVLILFNLFLFIKINEAIEKNKNNIVRNNGKGNNIKNTTTLNVTKNIKSSIPQKFLHKYKKNLLDKLADATNKKVENVNILNLRGVEVNFGNCFATLNIAIFSCEILLCKKLVVDSSKCLLEHQIYYKEYNMTIEYVEKINNCEEYGVVCVHPSFFMYYRFQNFVPPHRIFVLKNEILSNIPKKETDSNDLYIHIRSGDIFKNSINPYYAQPPLCFYEKIIENFSFRKIFIIAAENNSPVIDLLINKYKNAQFIHEDIKTDISYIVNAYNLVTSCSSFSIGLIKHSTNLKMLFEYDLMVSYQKKLSLHYDYQKYNKNYSSIIMKPSENYAKKMYPWRKSKDQINLMLTEKCESKFTFIPPKRESGVKNINE